MPHSALLVALLFSHPTSLETASFVPAGCLALSSCGGNLRLWPRVTRDYVYTDTTLPAPIGGLYGDEAMQMEPLLVSGTFVVATRTCHLVVVDARNAQQQSVPCRVLCSGHNQGLISSLGRRVSSLFTSVATAAFGGATGPEPGGGNAVFVRLLSLPRPPEQSHLPPTASYILLLMKKRLDLWLLDSQLKERFLTTASVKSLLPSQVCDQNWLAVDMAARYPSSSLDSSASSSSANPLVYLLLASAQQPNRLLLLSKTLDDQLTAACQLTSMANVDWPFQVVTPRPPPPGFYSEQGESLDEVRSSSNLLRLCLHDSTECVRWAGRLPDFPPQLYPSLLASVFCQYTGQVAVVEVFTGQLIATLDFYKTVCTSQLTTTAVSAAAPRRHSQSVSNLVSLAPGTVTSGAGAHLFVCLTRQHGLVALGPISTSGQALTPSSDLAQGVVSSSSEVLGLGRTALGLEKDTQSLTVVEPGSRRGTGPQDHVITLVDTLDSTTSGRRRRVVCQYCRDSKRGSSSLLVVLDGLHRRPVALAPGDRAFVGLCEAARVGWMGFTEQADRYLDCLLGDPETAAELTVCLVRFLRRLLNEPPLSDPRWHRAIAACSDDHLSSSSSFLADFSTFQFIAGSSSDTAPQPLLFKYRLRAKSEAIGRLRELVGGPYLSQLPPLVSLSAVHRYLLGSPVAQPRRYAGEQEPRDPASPLSSLFACRLAEDPEHGGPESLASQLLASLGWDRLLQASEDCAPEGSDDADGLTSPARVHLVAALSLAEEIVEFARAVYVRLVRQSHVSLQAVFKKTAISAGLPSNVLCAVDAQDAVLQMLTLMPLLVSELGDAVNRELNSSAQDEEDEEEEGSETEEEGRSYPRLVCSETSLHFLNEAARLISAGLTEVVLHRDRLLQSTNNGARCLAAAAAASFEPRHSYSASDETHYLPCWLTDARPYGVGDVLLRMFDQLVACAAGELTASRNNEVPSPPPSSSSAATGVQELAHEAAMRAVDWASCLLRLGQQRVQWASSTSTQGHLGSPQGDPSSRLEALQRLRRIRFWYVGLRHRLICAVADRLQMPEVALTLAERFADCQQMVRLCHVLETQADQLEVAVPHHLRLTELLHRVPPSYGLADCALQWYLSCGEHARVQSLLALLDSNERLTERGRNTCAETLADSTTTLTPLLSASPTAVLPRPVSGQTWRGRGESVLDENGAGAASAQGDGSCCRLPLLLASRGGGEKATVVSVQRFLNRQDTRDHAWSHLFATGQYAKAAEMLLQQACLERRFLGRRKTLLSLSKLGYLTPTLSSSPDSGQLSSPMEQEDQVMDKDEEDSVDAGGDTLEQAHPLSLCCDSRGLAAAAEKRDLDSVEGQLVLIDLLLEAVELQEQLPASVRRQLNLDPDLEDENGEQHQPRSDQFRGRRSLEPVLDPHSLVRLYLSAASPPPRPDEVEEEAKEDATVDLQTQEQQSLLHFQSAIRLVAIVQQLLVRRPELLGVPGTKELEEAKRLNRNLLLHIWCRAIMRDDWHLDENPNEITAMRVYSSMFVWRFICHLRRHNEDYRSLLPDVEEILQCEELSDLTTDSASGSHNFGYLVRSGFEHLKAAAR